MIKLAATGASEESSRIILVQLVQNWHEELKRLVPVD